MRKPYILEKKKIAAAQCEDRRDGLEVARYEKDRAAAEAWMDEYGHTEEPIYIDTPVVMTRAIGASKTKKPVIHQLLSKYNQQSRNGNKPRYIDIHYVGALGSAKNNCKYFAGGDRRASAHLFCDKEIWQSIPLDKAAWHCGGGLQDTGSKTVGGNKGATLHGINTNNNSIGIELCCKKNKKGQIVPTDEAIETATPLVRWLMDKYDIPASRVVRHFDVTGKHCPNGYVEKDPWKKLHARLTGQKTVAYPTVTLRRGAVGEQVERLQKCMNKIMKAGLEVDGSFGPATEKAVKAFQKKYKLEVDGIAGPMTRDKIIELLK